MKRCDHCTAPASRVANGVYYCYEHAIGRFIDAPVDALKEAAEANRLSLNGIVFVVEALVRGNLVDESDIESYPTWGVYTGELDVSDILKAICDSVIHYFRDERLTALNDFGIYNGENIETVAPLHGIADDILNGFPYFSGLSFTKEGSHARTGRISGRFDRRNHSC